MCKIKTKTTTYYFRCKCCKMIKYHPCVLVFKRAPTCKQCCATLHNSVGQRAIGKQITHAQQKNQRAGMCAKMSKGTRRNANTLH